MNKNTNSGSDRKHHHTEQIATQLQTTIENLQMIQNMVFEQRPCLDVLRQLSGIFVRLEECKLTIVHDHVSSCLQPNLKTGKESILEEVEQILKLALKNQNTASGSFH